MLYRVQRRRPGLEICSLVIVHLTSLLRLAGPSHVPYERPRAVTLPKAQRRAGSDDGAKPVHRLQVLYTFTNTRSAHFTSLSLSLRHMSP